MPIFTISDFIKRTPNLTIPPSGTVSDSGSDDLGSDNFVRIVD